MKRLFIRLAIGLIVIAGVAAAIWWSTRPTPIPVTLVSVATGAVKASVANTRAGTVEACQRTRLSPILGGRIDYLGVREGDRVKPGQVLLRLWNQDLEAQVKVAQATLTTARQRIHEVCALADQAERDARRAQQLREAGFYPPEKHEAAQAEAKSRRAACQTAHTDISQAQARLDAARTELKRTVLVAPFAGIVAEVTGELGEYTTPSPPGVATPPAIDLIDDTCLYVKAPMDEVDAPRIRVGMPALIRLDALPGRTFAGRVKRVAPYVLAVEKQARTVDVEVDFVQPESVGHLLVGYSADVEVILEERRLVPRVPTSALLEGNRALLYRPAQGDLEARVIKPGLSNWEYTEVLEGLKVGERIVVSLEKEGVEAGAKVQPEATAESGAAGR